MGTWINRASDANIDPRLLAWLQAAAAQSGYNVALQSGLRAGDPRYHGKGMAGDVQLIDPATGKVIPNYQNASSFAAYQAFANQVRAAQMASDPDYANRLRWGGYFSGPAGKYGAMDLMHFDVGGDQTPMGGGGWDTGLTEQQAKIWGLQPGGGYTGGPGTVATAFAPAVTGNTMVDSGLDFSGLAGAAGRGGSHRVSSGPIAPAQSQATPAPAFEAPDATPLTPDALAAPWKAAEADLTTPLADLFKVKTIGQAGTAALPGRRF